MKKLKNKIYDIIEPVKMLRWLSSLVKEYSKGYVAVNILDVIVSSSLSVIVVIFPKLIVDELMGTQQINLLLKYVCALVLISLFSTVFSSVTRRFFENKNFKMNNYFYYLMVKKTCLMDFSNLENSELLNKRQFASENFSAVGGLGGTLNAFWAVITNLIAFVGLLCIVVTTVNIYLPLVILVLRLITLPIENFVKKKKFGFVEENTENNKKFSYFTYLNNDYKYAKEIRMFSMSDLIIEKIRQFKNKSNRIFKKQASADLSYSIVSNVISTLQMAIIYGVLIWNLSNKTAGFSVGDFLMVATSLISLEQKLGKFLSSILSIKYNSKYIKEIKSFYELPDTLQSQKKSIPVCNNYEFTFENVSFRYPGSDSLILDNISCTINSNERLAIVGINGSGKTTFIKLLLRLYDPESGRIMLNGTDIKEFDYFEYHKLFSVVFQDFEILPFSVEENIAHSETIDEELLERSISTADIGEKIKSLEHGKKTYVKKIFDKDGVEFSGGELQKIAIARALYKSAPIYVLDEPTAALDPRAEEDVFLKFGEMTKGKTSLFISHRLSSCRFCDNIFVFNDKKIVQQGTHDVLVKDTNGQYSQLFYAQAQYYDIDKTI